MSPPIPTYYRFIVGMDNTYEIVGYDSRVIERGTMRKVTGDGFEYEITAQTQYSYRIGSGHFASWSIADGELDISFYEDATMTVRYASFVGRHP